VTGTDSAPRPGPALLPQWEAFVSRASDSPAGVRPLTLQAWLRCRDLGIDPEHLRYRFLDGAELADKRAANAELLEIARPYLQHLSAALSGRAHCVALADAEGWILELLEDPSDAFGGAATGICVGSSWNERDIGNNGIGTALATGQPVFVYGIEHYGSTFHSAHCLGVPIRINGRVMGCLDVSVTRPEDADLAYMTLAQACVASIESTLSTVTDMRKRVSSLERFAAIGGLLATTLHDLRNPLNVMRGISRIGESMAKDAGERAFFGRLSRQVVAMEDMVERLQDLTCVPRPSVTSPSVLVGEVLEDVKGLCAERGIRVEASLGGDDQCWLHPELFRRTIHNLVSNAIHAMPEGGALAIRSYAAGTWLVIEIADTGGGIPADIRDSVFEPFVSGRADGTGLGLFMVHQAITEEHKGRVRYETTEGKGTTFILELPLAAAEPPSTGSLEIASGGA
jgi:nitrogen-specific signal transduction histidine kinase